MYYNGMRLVISSMCSEGPVEQIFCVHFCKYLADLSVVWGRVCMGLVGGRPEEVLFFHISVACAVKEGETSRT